MLARKRVQARRTRPAGQGLPARHAEETRPLHRAPTGYSTAPGGCDTLIDLALLITAAALIAALLTIHLGGR